MRNSEFNINPSSLTFMNHKIQYDQPSTRQCSTTGNLRMMMIHYPLILTQPSFTIPVSLNRRQQAMQIKIELMHAEGKAPRNFHSPESPRTLEWAGYWKGWSNCAKYSRHFVSNPEYFDYTWITFRFLAHFPKGLTPQQSHRWSLQRLHQIRVALSGDVSAWDASCRH